MPLLLSSKKPQGLTPRGFFCIRVSGIPDLYNVKPQKSIYLVLVKIELLALAHKAQPTSLPHKNGGIREFANSRLLEQTIQLYDVTFQKT